MSTTGRSAPSGIPGRSGGTPLGIKIICVVGGIVSILGLLGGLVLLGGAGSGAVPGSSGGLGLMGMVAVVLSAISLIAYYGLWKLEYWAWILYMVVGGLSVLVDLANVEILGAAIGVVILAYVYSKRDLYEANR